MKFLIQIKNNFNIDYAYKLVKESIIYKYNRKVKDCTYDY